MLEKMAEGIPAEGMESLIPALVDRLVTVVDYLPEGSRDRARRPRTLGHARDHAAARPTASSSRRPGARRPPARPTPVDLGAGDFVSSARAARGRRASAAACGGRSARSTRARRTPRPRVCSRSTAGTTRAGAGHIGAVVPGQRRRRDRARRRTARRRAGGSWSRHPAPGSSSARATCSPSAASQPAGSTRCSMPPEPGVAHVVLSDARARLRGAGREARRAHRDGVLRTHDRRRPAASSRSSPRAAGTSSIRCS